MTNTDAAFWDSYFMRRAIELAQYGQRLGHRPFGCLIVDELGQVISETFGTELPTDPTRHSEMLAIKESCHIKKGLLHGCTLYNTHEPCLMCTGAILHSKVSRVVYGSSREDLPQLFRPLNVGAKRWDDTSHPPEVSGRVLSALCCQLFAGEIEQLVEGNVSARERQLRTAAQLRHWSETPDELASRIEEKEQE